MALKKAAKPAAAAPARRTVPSVGSQRTARAAEAKANPAPKPRDPRGIKVIATQMGYYDLKRRREGDVFYIQKESEFSERWMERVDKSARLKETGAQEALDRKHDEILGGKTNVQRDGADDDDSDDDDVRS